MKPSNKTFTWLTNPSVYLAGWKALVFGILIILASGYIGSFSNTHFDGVLDTHSGRTAPMWFFLSAGMIDWLCMALIVWLIAKMSIKNDFRTIDVFGTQALARWPMLLTALATLPPGYLRFTKTLIRFSRTQQFPENVNMMDAVTFGVALITMLGALCWMVYLMYNAFKVSCDPVKGKGIKLFIIAVIAAEILSKVMIGLLIKLL